MFAIANTDLAWFEIVRDKFVGRIVNFWTPTPWNVRGLHAGDRLYFMLKAPIRRIGGFGQFHRYAEMSASEAWSTYGPANGVDTLDALITKVQGFAEKRSVQFSPSDDPVIGCIELRNVFALDEEDYLRPEKVGHPFPDQVVKLKYFEQPDQLALAIDADTSPRTPFELVSGGSNYGSTLRKLRQGQAGFRWRILNNYRFQCAATGDNTPELLEAAHIQPYIHAGSNHPQNGICFRVDIHRLFDAGLITVSEEGGLIASKRLGTSTYSALNGSKVRVPDDVLTRPSAHALKYHRENIFR